MKCLFINNQKLSYKYVNKINAFIISLDDKLLYDWDLARELDIIFETFEQFLKKNNAKFREETPQFGRGYYFEVEKDIQDCIKYLENYLLTKKLKGSTLKMKYIEVKNENIIYK